MNRNTFKNLTLGINKAFIEKQAIALIRYTLLYMIPLLYWELLMRTQTGFKGTSYFFLLFLPAQGMFLATLTGWLKPKFNRWLTPAVLLLPFAFYVSQLIYFRIFG